MFQKCGQTGETDSGQENRCWFRSRPTTTHCIGRECDRRCENARSDGRIATITTRQGNYAAETRLHGPPVLLKFIPVPPTAVIVQKAQVDDVAARPYERTQIEKASVNIEVSAQELRIAK